MSGESNGPGVFEQATGVLGSVVTGIAGGAVGGPLGMAAGGVIGLVRGLTNQPHPQSQAPALLQAAARITEQVGESNIVAALEADPVKQETLRRAALEIAAQDEANYRAHVEKMFAESVKDRESARQTMTRLASEKSILAYGAPVASLIVMGLFAFNVVYSMVGTNPNALSAGTDQLLEYGFIAVISYWLGSSAGSARKDNRPPVA